MTGDEIGQIVDYAIAFRKEKTGLDVNFSNSRALLIEEFSGEDNTIAFRDKCEALMLSAEEQSRAKR